MDEKRIVEDITRLVGFVDQEEQRLKETEKDEVRFSSRRTALYSAAFMLVDNIIKNR